MALLSCSRICKKNVLASLNRFPSLLYAQESKQAIPKIIYKKYEEPKTENFEIRNERLKRPISPHLTIYAPQLTSMMSLSHRTTGIILSTYVMVLGIGAVILPHNISHYVAIIAGMHLSSVTIFIAKFLLAAPLCYHFNNGIRHLYWDTARGLSMKEVYSTGYAVLCIVSIVTLILAAL